MRDVLLLRGLDAARADRESRAVASDVVLVTATPTEHQQLERVARELGFYYDRQPGRYGAYFRIGVVGANRVVAIQVGMGAFAREGAAARCIQARAETQATTIILIGTAFGVDPTRQRIGDVVVSESVFLYDDRRIEDSDGASGYRVRYETARKRASRTWQEQFQRLGEAYVRNGDEERVEVGVILSGGARIESATYRDELLALVPSMDSPVVGGEMEGMGAVSAALTTDPEDPGWVVVKGISDFADAHSRSRIKDTRALAARASAMTALRVLQLPPRSE